MTGSARPVIAWAALVITVICLIVTIVSGVVNGVMLIGTLTTVVLIWAVGGFTRVFWSGPDPYDSRSRLDELDGRGQ